MSRLARTKVELLGGIEYAVVDEGEGPAVLLLHGYPDSADLWRHQIPVLRDAGYRVVAPDLRGFGESSKPQEVEAYRVSQIVGDVSTLLRRLSIDRAHVVGHDWGAIVAWVFASLLGSRVDHLAVVSVGHPTVYHSPSTAQRERSWYMLLYQFPGVSEALVRQHDWRLLRDGTAGGDTERYVADLGRPGALTAALNWYRANRSPDAELEPPARLPFVRVPTLAVWGGGDRAMLEEGVLGSSGFVMAPWRYERIEDAGHWVPLTAPDRFNELLLGFLGSVDTAVPVRHRRRF